MTSERQKCVKFDLLEQEMIKETTVHCIATALETESTGDFLRIFNRLNTDKFRF